MNKSQISKALIFLFIVVILDQTTGLILRSLYFQQKTGQNRQLNYVFSQCKADVLIFGNSRAQHHYISPLISETLKLSCYNAGQDGGHSILLPLAQIKVLTDRYSPKIIIVELSPDDIMKFNGAYERLSILLPYYKKYPDVCPLIFLRSPFERIKLISAIYPFNSDVINIIRFNTNTNAARKKDVDGYVPLKGVMSIDMLRPEPQTGEEKIPVVDANMVNALVTIVRICKGKSINLFVINSPIYHAFNKKQISASFAAEQFLEIIKYYKINYLDFSSDPNFTGHFEWFKDEEHLNEKGAKIFSTLVIDKLLQTI